PQPRCFKIKHRMNSWQYQIILVTQTMNSNFAWFEEMVKENNSLKEKVNALTRKLKGIVCLIEIQKSKLFQ
nr:hypothetical protein [Bacteriovoracaceae bacterium]